MTERSSLGFVGISGSLRLHSYNSGALRAVAALIPEGTTFSIASLADLPFHNADVEQRDLPPSVERFRAEVAAADALIFATPEYNFSVSGVNRKYMAPDSMHKPKAEKRVGLHYTRFRPVAP